MSIESNNQAEETRNQGEETQDQNPEMDMPQTEETYTTDEALAKAQLQVQDLQDKLLRQMAEFDNFRKRNARERIDMIKNASEDMLKAVLPVLDDFERVMASSPNSEEAAPFLEGVKLVQHKLVSITQSKGLTRVDSTGQPFDPTFHEAIAEIPAASEEAKGIIIDTVEPGYTLNEKIIRYAKVVVGK